jgi:hypothetical protein
MTQTEQLMNDLRDAIRTELIDELRTYRAGIDEDLDANYFDGLDDAINALARA